MYIPKGLISPHISAKAISVLSSAKLLLKKIEEVWKSWISRISPSCVFSKPSERAFCGGLHMIYQPLPVGGGKGFLHNGTLQMDSVGMCNCSGML